MGLEEALARMSRARMPPISDPGRLRELRERLDDIEHVLIFLVAEIQKGGGGG